MPYLSLSLLGPFQAWTANGSLQLFRTVKERALLSYLVVENGRPHRREALADLFWPDRPETIARNNLRQALYGIRQVIGEAGFDEVFSVTSDEIQVNFSEGIWLDLAAYDLHRAAVQEHNHDISVPCQYCMHHMRDAVEIYRGAFLEDVYLDTSEPFQEWLAERRETYRQFQIRALEFLIYEYDRASDYTQAALYATALSRLETLREPGYRRIITLLAKAGRRGAALEWYENYCRRQQETPGGGPSADMEELAEQIRLGRLDPGAADVYPTYHNLPEYLTPFIGRESELTLISRALENPGARLITIAGIGGVGKTRLAVKAARLRLRDFADGVFFIPAESLVQPDQLIDAVGKAIGLVPSPQDTMRQVLVNYLRPKHVLLVVDNFEHLMEGRAILLQLLQAAPFLKIMVTSREVLNLQAETVIALNGLPVPPSMMDDSPGQETRRLPEAYAAVQLFFERASRVIPPRPGSDLAVVPSRPLAAINPAELEDVVRICQLVDGLPLGIELAASQSRDYSFHQIAGEVQRSLEFLQTSLSDLPARHRSLRVSFEHSWDLLPPDEREVFIRLAVFPSSFSGAAAQVVAGAAMPWLMRLENRSLVRRVGPGRYEMHPLIREFAIQKLRQFSRREEDQALRQHAEFFCGLLGSRRDALTGKNQVEALEEAQADMGNIAAAWDWAVAHQSFDLLETASFSMMYFLESRSQWSEGDLRFGEAVKALRPTAQGSARERVLGFLIACQGWFRCRLTDFASAEEMLLEGLNLLNGEGVERERAFAHFAIGFLYTWMARFKDAWLQLTTCLSQAQQAGDKWAAAWAEEVLAEISFESGQSGLNEAPFLASLANFEKVGDLRGCSRALNYLSNVTLNQGKLSAARGYMERMLGMMERIGDVWGAAGSYSKMGQLAMANGDCGQAWRLYRRSLTMFQRTGDQRRTAITMRQLGEAAMAFGRDGEAREHFRQALELALRLQSEAIAQDVLSGVANVMMEGDQKERAVALLFLILSLPAADQNTALRAARLIEKAREILPAAQIERAQAEASRRGLWETVEDVLRADFPAWPVPPAD